MTEKVLIISSSSRKNGNSAALAGQFAKGAADAGNEVELIYVEDIKPEFCKGCLYCQTHENCIIRDNMKTFSLGCKTPMCWYLRPPYIIILYPDNSRLFSTDSIRFL